jgi:hypothetical protein
MINNRFNVVYTLLVADYKTFLSEGLKQFNKYKMEITKDELYLISEAVDGTDDKYTIDELFNDEWDDSEDAVELRTKLNGWSVKASFKGDDTFITFISSSNKKTKIEIGFDDEIYKLNVWWNKHLTI